MANNRTSIPDEFTIENIGASLLQELSTGLYTPEHVIREYVQNAVDAHKEFRELDGDLPEETILINIGPDSISIIDYGIGMNEDEIRNVKGIAISKKAKKSGNLTGQKGVGIWSGLTFFETMIVKTTKAGSDKRYILTLKFGEIHKRLKDEDYDTISVGDVLRDNHTLEFELADEDDHGTIVTLESPRDQAPIFLDPEKIKDSVRRYAPCQIDPAFKFYTQVVEWYAENNLVIIPIAVCGEDVLKTFSNNLAEFAKGTISVEDKQVVKYWMAISDSNSKLAEESSKIPSGFSLVQNGFTLDRNFGVNAIANYPKIEDRYVNWCVGEMHVTTEHFLPKLNREGLQLNGNTFKLLSNLREWYAILEAESRQISAIRNHTKAYGNFQDEVDKINKMFTDDVEHGIIDKAIDKFILEYARYHKSAAKVAELNKNSDFPLHIYKLKLHREMTMIHKILNTKWNEVRQEKTSINTLVQILKGESREKRATSKNPDTATVPPAPAAAGIAIRSLPDTDPVDFNPAPLKLKLTSGIAVSLLRQAFDQMDTPLVSKPVIEKIIREYNKILVRMTGDV